MPLIRPIEFKCIATIESRRCFIVDSGTDTRELSSERLILLSYVSAAEQPKFLGVILWIAMQDYCGLVDKTQLKDLKSDFEKELEELKRLRSGLGTRAWCSDSGLSSVMLGLSIVIGVEMWELWGLWDGSWKRWGAKWHKANCISTLITPLELVDALFHVFGNSGKSHITTEVYLKGRWKSPLRSHGFAVYEVNQLLSNAVSVSRVCQEWWCPVLVTSSR